MTSSTGDITRHKRAPATGTPVLVRLQPDMLSVLDRLVEETGLTRPEALRTAFKSWVEANGLAVPWPKLHERDIAISLRKDVLAAIDDIYGGSDHQMRTDTIEFIVSDWLRSNGHLKEAQPGSQ